MKAEFGSRAQAAFSYAQEVSKQLITLSTAVFALTLTFAEKFERSGAHARTWLEVGWGFYLLSIFFGIGLLMTLAGHIDAPLTEEGDDGIEHPVDSIYAPVIRLVGAFQIIAFALALILTFIYGIKAT